MHLRLINKNKEIKVAIAILIFLLYFMAPLTSFTALYDYRLVGLCFLIVYFLPLKFSFRKLDGPMYGRLESLFILLFSLFFLLDLTKGFILTAVGDALFIFLIIIMSAISVESLRKAFEEYNRVVNIMAIFFIFYVILATVFPSDIGDINIPLIKSFGYYGFGGLQFPQLIFLADQASTIPVVVVAPLLFSLFYDERISRFRYTIVALFLSLGGSFYVFVAIGIFAIPFLKFLPKSILCGLPIFAIVLFTSISILMLQNLSGMTNILDVNEDGRTLIRKELIEGTFPDLGISGYLVTRMGSAIERAFTLVWQYETYAKSPVLGAWDILDFSTLGSILLKFGIRGGVIGICLGILIFITSIRTVVDFSKQNSDKLIYCSFVYSFLIQPIIYNENGFGSGFAMMMILLISKLFMVNNTQS